MNLPDNLPPLPPVPEGFDRWVYRGIGWKSDTPVMYDMIAVDWEKVGDSWCDDDDAELMEAAGNERYHYIEAVRDAEQPQAEDAKPMGAKWLPYVEAAGDAIRETIEAKYIKQPQSTGVEAREWQSIETAPKSSKAVLIYCEEYRNTYIAENSIGKWRHFGGFNTVMETPTHWMPLPPPPKP